MLNMDQDVVNAIEGVLAQQVETIKSSNVGSRPSAKSIYNQRKQYAQSLSRSNTNFYHRVEHLLTCELDDGLQNVQDCVSHLRALDAEGKVWGQEMILQVENGQLILTDLESQDSLERIPLQCIDSCDSVLGSHPYKSLLVVTVQSPESPSILLFQSDEHPANVLQRNLQKTLTQWKEDQHRRDSIRNKLQNALTQNKYSEQNYQPQPLDSPQLSHSGGRTPQDSPVYQRRRDPGSRSFQPPPVPISPSNKADAGRDIEILNHVLADIEMFVGKLNLQKKKKDKSAVPESEFIECFQKIKYSFNLMAKAQDQMYQPTAPELVHILMDILPTILSKCPGKNTAGTALSPFLTQRAILLLSSCVTEKERRLWESLGDPWLRTREDSPNGRSVPPYIPTFSDGWSPPASVPSNGQPQPEVQQSSKTPPINRHFQPLEMKVAYDFDARNQQELSVKKGDSVKVLDQSRQWWMVENVWQQRGFVPSNILESTDYNQQQQVPLQAETLQQSSTPREVTEWLQSLGFSRITVKCLGVLSGDQLLELSREDLKAVCPEEGGRVFSQLNQIRASLMM